MIWRGLIEVSDHELTARLQMFEQRFGPELSNRVAEIVEQSRGIDDVEIGLWKAARNDVLDRLVDEVQFGRTVVCLSDFPEPLVGMFQRLDVLIEEDGTRNW